MGQASRQDPETGTSILYLFQNCQPKLNQREESPPYPSCPPRAGWLADRVPLRAGPDFWVSPVGSK